MGKAHSGTNKKEIIKKQPIGSQKELVGRKEKDKLWQLS